MNLLTSRSRNVRWKSIAFPTEHGGWSFISEPIVLGLLLTTSWGGLALAIGAFAAFLLRQPLKIVLKDFRVGRNVPRTLAALRFVMIYGSITIMAGIVTLLTVPSVLWLVPIGFSIPLVAVQLWHDAQNQSRNLIAELSGALATGAVVASIVLIGGWALAAAMGLWLAIGVKGITAVLYVRSRLRLERNKPAMVNWTLVAHAVGFGMLLIAVSYGLLPWTVLGAMFILTVRAGVGLSSLRKVRPPKILGMQELGYGFGYVLLTAIGYFMIF